MRVGQEQAVLGDEDDAFRVDLQTLVECGGPGRPETAAEVVAGLHSPSQGQRQHTGKDGIRLRQVHRAGGEVNRVGALAVLTLGSGVFRRIPVHLLPSRLPGRFLALTLDRAARGLAQALFRGSLRALFQRES